MDERARKFMAMHKALQPWNDVDRLYDSRKEGRGAAIIQDSVDTSIQRLDDYIKKPGGRLITASKNNTNNTSIKWTKYNQKTKMGRKISEWTFQATNKRLLTQENFDMAKKVKPLERNWISSDSGTNNAIRTN